MEHQLNGITQEQFSDIENRQNWKPKEIIICGHKPEDYEQQCDAFKIGSNYVSPNRGNSRWDDGLGTPSDVLIRHQKCRICGAEIKFEIDAYNADILPAKK